MPNPLSAGIRARFELLFEQGLTGRETGRCLAISAASASRLGQKLKRGLVRGMSPTSFKRCDFYKPQE